jgi:cell division septation protein DedD
MKQRFNSRVCLGLGVLLAGSIAMMGCSSNDQTTIHYRDTTVMNGKAAEEAEKAVAEAKNTKTSKERKPASRGGVWVVQVGAFKQKENAEKLHEKLKAAGYPVTLQSLQHSRNGELHLVRFEPVSEKSQAQESLDKFVAKESLDAHLLRVE